jgi:chorismate mutase
VRWCSGGVVMSPQGTNMNSPGFQPGGKGSVNTNESAGGTTERSNFAPMPALIKNLHPLSGFLSFREKPLIIAGPCSAESEEQVLQTARELAKIPQVAAFRCGLWKPRSRPGDFEGSGEEGMKWLKKVKLETGLKIAVEVALPVHIDICLKNEIDILWIGSRTVVNPFSVNEIAEALKGVDIPVMVKNPVSPDLLLWIGALERLSQNGIRKLAAVHRGFSAYGSKPFRNLPLWEIPIELRRLIPGLPVLVDPSHISGNKGLLAHVAQTAIDFTFDGLMIESHIHPEKALTDRNQQITPSELKTLIANLSLPSFRRGEEEKMIADLRNEIDDLDSKILELLGQRMETAAKIGNRKKEAGMDALQLERWKQVVEDRLEKGVALGLSRNFLMKLLHAIHEESLRIQAGKKE